MIKYIIYIFKNTIIHWIVRKVKGKQMYNEDTWTIGNIVKMLRDEQEVTGSELSYGLCSLTTLSRIETSEREMSVIFAMVLFGRLGYHPDKFELYGSKEEYVQYEQREAMENLKKEGNYAELELQLIQYKASWAADIEKDVLQQQFVNGMEGLLCFQKGEYAKSAELLERAVAFTIPEWKDEWLEKAVIGEAELEIMGMLADALDADGNVEGAFKIRNNILTYLEKKPTSRRQMLRIYTEMIAKLAPVLLEQKNIGQALKWCEDGLAALAEGGRMFHWPTLLYWKGRCLEELYHTGQAELAAVEAAYIRAFYIFRLFENVTMAEEVKLHLDKEVPGWEYIKLEKL